MRKKRNGPDWPEEEEFVCRGKEQIGRYDLDQPYHLHIVQLFVTGSPRRFPLLTSQDTVTWGNQARHSYVNDGEGALSIVAHPKYVKRGETWTFPLWDEKIRELTHLKGLAGIEISHKGICGWVDRLWDQLLTDRFDRDERLIWGFAGDDTHSTAKGKVDLSWIAVKILKHTTWHLKQAMQEGSFYASNGVRIKDFRVTGPTITVSCETPSEVRWLKSGQYYEDLGLESCWKKSIKRKLSCTDKAELSTIVDPLILPEAGANTCLKVDRNVRESSYTLNQQDGTTNGKAARYVRCIVLDPDDINHLRHSIAQTETPLGISEHHINIRKAFSMPFRLLDANKIESPYPKQGAWVRGMTHNHADLPADRLLQVKHYHKAYRDRGQEASFETGYSYRFFPYIPHPQAATPVVLYATPDRCGTGENPEIDIVGRHFHPQANIFIGTRRAATTKVPHDDRITVRIPDNLQAGSYDVTVVNTDTPYQHTLAESFFVQDHCAHNHAWQRFTLADGLPDHDVYFVTWLDGKVWAGTRNGLAHYDGNRFIALEGAPANAQALDMDHNDNLWVCGWNGVDSQSPKGVWKHWGEDNGLEPPHRLHSILCASHGQVLLTHYLAPHVSAFDGTEWRTESLPSQTKENAATLSYRRTGWRNLCRKLYAWGNGSCQPGVETS